MVDTISIEKKYLDNLYIYIEKLENHAKWLEGINNSSTDKIDYLNRKIKNIKRNKARISNKLQIKGSLKNIEVRNIETNTVNVESEMDWVDIEDENELLQ